MSGAGNTKEDIVSQALLLIGEAPISSFSEGVGGLVASNLYDTTRDDLLSAYRWRFAVGKSSLSRLTSTPLNEWQYAFQLPTNLLLLIRSYPNSQYEVYEDKLYSNNSTCDIDYIFRPEPGAFPAYFVKSLSYKLASEFSISITNNQTMADRMEDRAIKALTKARFNDSQGRTPSAIVHRPFIEARR